MKKQTSTCVLCKVSLLGIFLFFSINNFAQEWAWMSGSNVVNEVGTYGTQGTADPANVPSARNGVVGWTDNDGNLWIFGGFGATTDAATTGRLNDLWKYDITANEWTWVSGTDIVNSLGNYGTLGVADPANVPPARNRPLYWTDNDGNFWLFGGLGPINERLNDLWKYEVDTNQWTWMKGSNGSGAATVAVYGSLGVEDAANVPGGRNGGFNWVDNDGNLWLFGGTGLTESDAVQAQLDDVWKYTISTNNWTWMGGSKTNDPVTPAVYGDFRVADAANTPGARVSSVSWTDSNGDFWLFGGGTGGGIQNRQNDLWKYSVDAGQWAWIDGDSLGGMAGDINIADPTSPTEDDNPGARNGSMSWLDANDNLWLFGGWGLPVLGTDPGFINDTWVYNTSENLWYYKTGSLSGIDEAGVYGMQGVSDPANTPGGKASGASMVDNNGFLWLFGGVGGGRYNDLWQLSGDIFTGLFDPDPAPTLSVDLYPNPVSDNLFIRYEEAEQYEIFNALGELISNGILRQANGQKGIFTEEVLLPDLATGIYVLRIHKGHQVGVKKFVVAQ